jgi:hypothetical protein
MLKRVLLAGLASLMLALPAWATSVLPLYLDQIVDMSVVAFEGTCTGNRVERDEKGFIATYTTFKVQDVLKGEVGTTYTIKQIGGELSDGSVKLKMSGVPTFTVGGSYVVFLNGVSSAGFSSPVGLFQGSFNVIAGDLGPQVTNGRDFKMMTSRMAGQVTPQAKAKMSESGPVERMGLDDFKAMVRGHVGAIR